MPAQTTGHYLEPVACAANTRLPVPATVYNAVLNRNEPALP